MDNNETSLKVALDTIVKSAKNISASSVGLGLLFPKVRKILNTFDGNLNTTSAALSHRISAGEFAAAYFSLDPKEATWERSELDRFVLSETPGDALRQLVSKTQSLSLSESDKVRLRGQLLGVLEEGFASGKPLLSSEWIRAVLDVSPIFLRARDVKPSGFLYRTTNEERLRWLLVRPMRDMSPDERASLIRPNIADVLDISLLCDVVRSMVGDVTADGAKPPYGQNALGSKTDELRERLVARVREIAADGKFWSQALPGNILWFWRNSDHQTDVKHFTSSSLADRNNIEKILVVPVSEVVSTAGNYFQVQSTWNNVIDLDTLDTIADELIQSGTDEQKKAAERYLGARKNARESPF